MNCIKRTVLWLTILVVVVFYGTVPALAIVNLTAGAISTTSDTYQLAIGWANVLTESGSTVSITPLEAGGTVKLLRGVVSKKWDIGFIGSPHFANAVAGELNFASDPPSLREAYKQVRVLFATPSELGQYVVRGDSKIYTVTDLKGKKVAIGTPGGMAGFVTTRLFEEHGLSLEKGDYQAQRLDYGPALDEMRNNFLDAALLWGGVPHAAAYEFSRQIPLRFLPLDRDAFERFKKHMPGGNYYALREFSPEMLKAVYGENSLVQDSPANMWTFQMMVIVRDDMPEDIAYEITKKFWENLDIVKKISVSLESLNYKEALKNLSAEFHPGALRYYKEKGWL